METAMVEGSQSRNRRGVVTSGRLAFEFFQIDLHY